MKYETLNLIEDKIGNTFEFTGTIKDVLNKNPSSASIKQTSNKDHMKLKCFCTLNDTIVRVKRQTSE